METTMQKQPKLYISERSKELIIDVISYLFVLLFVYTAVGKLTTIDTFLHVLEKYPLIGDYNASVAYCIPVVELMVALLLIVPSTKKFGLVASLVLMAIFLTYIIYMLLSNASLPCSCGGIISKLSWQQHIWFNSIFLILACVGLRLTKK